jgi:predicted nucleic acid-binding protein
MAYLFDTNLFLRLARRNDPQRQLVLDALRRLRSRNEVLCFTPQVLSEFWNVCTRPASARGGLGLSLTETERKARLIERHFRLLPDSLSTFREWRRLVVAHSVMGVEVHDAKLVASMSVYVITNLLTFNVADFKRYPAITALSPVDVK